jgi:acetamidase/formamidase family protein
VARRGDWEIPVRPFVGTIGTSPTIVAISTLSPGDHGGNMDVPDTCVGNTVYLPVRVEGGLFFTGDCHVAQGQGELPSGTCLRISAREEPRRPDRHTLTGRCCVIVEALKLHRRAVFPQPGAGATKGLGFSRSTSN